MKNLNKTAMEEQIDFFDENLRKLKVLYDLFFAGALKMPPIVERRKLDIMLHEMSRETIRDNALRFRFTSLGSKYQQFRELWSRRMREREEGPMDFKSRKALFTEVGPEAISDNGASEARRAVPVPVTPPGADSYVKVGVEGSGEAIREIFEQITTANAKLGKPSQLSIEQVGSMISSQVEKIRAKFGAKAVGFKVETVDGKVKLKARPEGTT